MVGDEARTAEGDERFAAVKTGFPKGIPASFEKLSPAQKEILEDDGGDVVALLAGKVDNLYAAMNGHDLTVMDERERKALGEINAFFLLSPETKTAILVFGAEFDVKRHSDIFDPECIVTPPEFQKLF